MVTIEGLKGTRYEVGILLRAHMERASAAVGIAGVTDLSWVGEWKFGQQEENGRRRGRNGRLYAEAVKNSNFEL